MPSAFCPNGHKEYWHARRGTRLADMRCQTCNDELRKALNRTCEAGDKFYGQSPYTTVCPDGHPWKARVRRTPTIQFAGANRRAKRRWGPLAFASEVAHVAVADKVPGYEPGPGYAVPYIVVVGVLAAPGPIFSGLRTATIYGWGKSYREALVKATENGH